MKRILIIGSGGREHAIGLKLVNTSSLFYYGPHNNPGLSSIARFVGLGKVTDISKILTLAKAFKIDMVVIGPEAGLQSGLANILQQNGMDVIGPRKEVAKIETSKGFARQLLDEYSLGDYSPIYKIFKPGDQSYPTFITLLKNECVIKADGLHGGKGVKVFGEHLHTFQDAVNYCKEIHNANEDIVIEEKLYGQEFSLQSFCDGTHIKHTIPVQDFKRVYDMDKGPNTGSMGSITGAQNKLHFLSNEYIKICEKINESVMIALCNKTGIPYIGILYGSFMLTDNNQIKIIEFNARFGDPECINILNLMQNSLLDIFNAMITGTLDQIHLTFNPSATVFKYMVPKGYPLNPFRSFKLRVPFSKTGNYIYASMTSSKYTHINDRTALATQTQGLSFVGLGSRTFGYISRSTTINQCAKHINRIFDRIKVLNKDTLFYRRDIGLEIKSLTYAQSGVNIEEGNKVVSKIQSHVESTYNEHVLGKFGDFGGLFKFGNKVLVSSTDGVGTKSILTLQLHGKKRGYEMLGQDLVNHCVNDILVKGADPLFFLDYFAADKIDSDHVEYFVKGVAKSCKQSGCVLIGGETAEMSSVYNKGHSDLVGTIIGSVDPDKIIDGQKNIKENDLVIGLPSSGPHTNGYTLLRKMLKIAENVPQYVIDNICNVHKCYYDEVKTIQKLISINGLCHLTGGGFIDNIPRILPQQLTIDWNSFEFNKLFQYIQTQCNLSRKEMMRTFNCGFGMLVFINPVHYPIFESLKIEHDVIGRVSAN